MYTALPYLSAFSFREPWLISVFQDGTAEESNTAPLGEQDGGHVDGEAETHVAETHISETLEAVKLNGEGEDGAPVAAAV